MVDDFTLTGKKESADDEDLEHGLRETTKEERDQQARTASRNMRAKTAKEKINDYGLKPLHPLYNMDLFVFGLACALTGASVALFYVEYYKVAAFSVAGVIACFPAALLHLKGDFAKAFRLYLAEAVRKVIKFYVEKNSTTRDLQDQSDGFWLSVYNKVNKLDEYGK